MQNTNSQTQTSSSLTPHSQMSFSTSLAEKKVESGPVCSFPLMEIVTSQTTMKRPQYMYLNNDFVMSSPEGEVVVKRPISYEKVFTYPFSQLAVEELFASILKKMPYFDGYFSRLAVKFGFDWIAERLNEFHVPQFKKGVQAYYEDIFFGTRRRRDELVKFFDKMEKQYTIKAEAGINQQDSQVQEENTTFTDQRETISDDGYITTQTLPNLQKVSMPEDEWHVRNIMSKPIPMWTGEWSTSMKRTQILKYWDLPGAALFGPHYNMVSTFTFFRGHPKVRFQINGTKFHSGRLMAVFVPQYDETYYDNYLYSISNMTSMPHVMLDASIANSGILDLPFVHMNTYFNTAASTRNWQSLGRVMLVVFNQLAAAESSSQEIGVTAWISYDNCELHQPCFAHKPALPGAPKLALQQRVVAESGIEGLVKSALPMVADLVAPGMGGIAGALGDVAGGAMNQDKPTDPVEISRWVPNIVTGLSQGEGLDKSSRLCLTAGSYTIPDADLISTTQDDMNLLELCKIPTRLTVTEWGNKYAAGKLLTRFAVCPHSFRDFTGGSVRDVITPTMLSYISRYFKFWRGSIRYKIQLIASQMHTGRLMIAYGAGVNLESSDFDKASYLNTYIIDLQEKHEVEFVVPFMSERPWLRCDRFKQVGLEKGDQNNFENVGYLDIYVLNRLSNPESVAADIDVNVFISAGSDFELAFPSDLTAFQAIGYDIPSRTPKAEALSGEQTVTTRTDEGVITLGKGAGRLAPAGSTTMGENAMDLKTLLRRYTKMYTNNRVNISDNANYISFVNSPTISGVSKTFSDYGVQCRTALCHFSELFTFWRGSIRYKLTYQYTGSSNNLLIKVFHIPGSFKKGSFTPAVLSSDGRATLAAMESQGVLVAGTNVQGSMEFEIPFYTPYTQLRTINKEKPSSLTATGLVIITFDSPKYEKGDFLLTDLYQAAGDDFTLNYLRAAPIVQFVRNTEIYRRLSDDTDFIYDDFPPIPKSSDSTVKEDDQQGSLSFIPKAEALSDYIPGVSAARQTLGNLTSASVKVESVCDTANHILQQASKKLGLSQDEEEDEENRTTTIIEDASAFCSPILPILECALSYIKMLPETMSSYLKPDLSITDIIVEVSNLVSGFTAFLNTNTLVLKVCALVTITSTLLKGCTIAIKNSLYHFAHEILTKINGSNQGNELPVAEALSFDLVAPLTATLAVGIGAIGFKKIPSDKETIDMCKGISEKLKLFNFGSTAIHNVKSLWNEIKDLMQWCIDYIMGLISPVLLAQLKLERNFGKIEEWTQFIDSLENIAYADQIHYDYEFKNKLYRAIDEGKLYNSLLLEGKCGRAASVIREYVRKITEIGLHCERSKNELPFRKDPFCIFMYGPTNIGKSGCITTLGFDIMDNLGYPQHNRWCAVNCTEKFFSENYRQQAGVYFDDFSTFSTEEQYQKFFNLKANTAFPLDMAFRKGEYFNSDFIFGTTNSPYPKPNFVTNHDALWRRRDILIEAAWNDEDEEIAWAVDGQADMAPHRRLDNTHLKYRIVNSSSPTAQAGQWMTYQQLVTLCTERAHVHLTRQQQKLTHDLTRAGYIVPHAEAGEVRRICIEAAKNSPSLQLFDPDLWEHLTWDQEHQEFILFAEGTEDYVLEWENLKEFFDNAGLDLKKTLRLNSYEVKPKATIMTKIKCGLKEFKDFIGHQVDKIIKDHPWIKVLGQWSILLAGAFAALGALWFGTKRVAHKCACALLVHFGFRCGFCGKWPALSAVRDGLRPWILEQWQTLYGSLPYKDYHRTTLQEEAALLSLQKKIKCEITEPFLGTNIHAESVYSDVTKGQARMKISAQHGPYAQDVKGQKTLKVSAQATPYSVDVKGQTANRIAAESENVDALISQRIFPYLYRLRTYGKAGLSSLCINGYAIGDRLLLINQHFFYGMEDGDLFEIFHNGAWMPVEYRKDSGSVIPNKDLCIFNMPKQFHSHKSNVHHFITEQELTYFQTGRGALCKLDSALNNIQVENLQIKAQKELKYEMDIKGGTVPLYIQKAWSYNKCSSYGDCGSPLVAYSDRLTGKILGIHTASSPQTSYAQLITREMLQDLVKRVNGTPQPKAEAVLGNLIPSGHLGRIGKAPKGKEFYQSPKTEIIPTPIQGIISQPMTQPAVLSTNDPRLEKRVNPLRLGIEKYSFCSVPFPLEHRRIVNEMMADEVRLLERVRDPKPLTLEESVLGIPELEGYERLPQKTSPGYPWILTRPKGASGKSYLFDEEGLPLFDLRQAVAYREEQARKLERIESVWVDCLKDERRPLEKIKKGSTRVFTIPPVDFSLLMRKYTMDFCVAVKNSRSFMNCKVGIDPQSLEWTTLYYWLAEFSPLCVAGDFSRFDGSMPADLIDDCRKDIDAFYDLGENSQEDKNVREILFDELIHTIHLARDEFYMTHIGNKSGNPITVILNSLINDRYMALAWLGLCEKFNKMDYFSMAKFKQNVRRAIYGDDNLLAIKEEVIEWFNQETISEYLSDYKIIYTNEEKTGITKYKKLDECTFLKQSFKNHETLSMIKVPHMKMTTILELLNWTRLAPDQDELLFDNCNDALRFSYFYGEKFFNQLRDKIIAALESVDKKFLPKTFMDYHLWFFLTIGVLKSKTTAEGFLTEFATTDSTRFQRFLMMTTLGPVSWLLLGKRPDDNRLRTDRLAICIPSGEGKSWLANKYPHLFVDHDSITLPTLERKYSDLSHLRKWMAIGNEMLNPQQYDTPENDPRILLTHHPNTTNRTIWRQYKLPYPNFNRNNFANRLALDCPIVRSRAERNEEILTFAHQYLKL